jgi:TonB family protein
VVVAAILVPLTDVAAQDIQAGSEDIEAWESEISKIETLLQRGGERRAIKALDFCLQLYDDMLGRLGPGEQSSRLLGQTLFLLAVAEARLEDTEVAAWHWVEAQNISPALRRGKLQDYGDVAPLLQKHLISDQERQEILQQAAELEEGLSLPTPVGMAPIGYPGGARRQRIEGTTEVVVVIDQNGVPIKPVLRRSCGVPGFDVAVMETARLWTFTPAYRAGQAVVGTYVLSARFSLGSGG